MRLASCFLHFRQCLADLDLSLDIHIHATEKYISIATLGPKGAKPVGCEEIKVRSMIWPISFTFFFFFLDSTGCELDLNGHI